MHHLYGSIICVMHFVLVHELSAAVSPIEVQPGAHLRKLNIIRLLRECYLLIAAFPQEIKSSNVIEEAV